MQQPRALVIGAGIGGLTAAVALHRRGWAVTVWERAATLEPVGAAISVAPNALRALDVIGLGDRLRAMVAWHGDGGLRLPSGRWLSRTNPEAAAERFGDSLVLLHRAVLVDLLAAALPEGTVHTGAPAELADPGSADRPARVTTPDGDVEAELVVGADGVRSGARRALFPDHPGPAYAGFTTWRTVVPGRETPFAPHETWGRGRAWGTQPMGDGRIYAYAAAVAPPGAHARDDEKSELRRLFGDWHDPIPGIIAASESSGVLRHDVHAMTVPLPAYHRGRTALLGDAAHAMAPTLGQGGNQAIEDAIVLAHHATPGTGLLDGALAAYSAERLPRTMDVVRRSARVSRMMMLGNRPAALARNTLISAVNRLGPRLALRALDGIADWRPPTGGHRAEATYAAGAPDGGSPRAEPRSPK